MPEDMYSQLLLITYLNMLVSYENIEEFDDISPCVIMASPGMMQVIPYLYCTMGNCDKGKLINPCYNNFNKLLDIMLINHGV